MSTRIIRSVVAFCSLICVAAASGQIEDNKVIPFNPSVATGKLQGTIPYYILKNSKPEKRLFLILAVNAGAVLEDADQNGLAHFCEHMAFNGTKDFPKQDLVNFLESTGVRFGADLNAYTNQDETVYMLTLPINDVKTVIKGVQVLKDWAGYVSYTDDDIQSERGVVTEEWRLGRGANERVEKKHYHAMYNGSPYEFHDVIGDTAILLHCQPDRLRAFYKKWYRPENLSVIAVGDIDPSTLSELLQKYFVLPSSDAGINTNPRPTVLIPPHKETFVSIASDPELQKAECQILVNKPADTTIKYLDFKRNIVEQLASAMINSRLSEIVLKSNPPISSGSVGKYNLARQTAAFYATADAADKNVLNAYNTLETELLRVKKHGFTDTELKRAKDEMMAQMEKYYNERDKTESQQLAFELMRHALFAESVPGIAREYEIYQHYVPGVTAQECADFVSKSLTDENQAILFSVPESNGYKIPTEQQVRDLKAAIEMKNIDPYVDKVITKPLLAEKPTAGGIVKDESIPEIDARKLTLTNGATVILKKTDFKNDEILFSAMSFGGKSLGSVSDNTTLNVSADLVNESGLGDFNLTDLQKLLQGKNCNVSPYIAMSTQGMKGNSSPKDFETMMQMAYLYFTAPRIDKESFDSWMTRTKSDLENKDKSPERTMFDSVSYIMSGRSAWTKPLSVDQLKVIDQTKALSFYKQRFANAAGFTFWIVGNYDEKTVDDYIRTYLASLPGNAATKETWKDVGIRTQRGKLSKTILKGEEPKSFVALIYDGPCKYDAKTRYDASALCEVMSIRLREQLREEKSGVYFVFAQPNIDKIPEEQYSVAVIFGCSPDRVDELTKAVEKEVDYLKNNLVDDSYIQKVKEIQTKEREVSKKENNFWSQIISQIVQYNDGPEMVAERDKLISNLSKEQIKEAAQKFLNPNNYAKFALKPAMN